MHAPRATQRWHRLTVDVFTDRRICHCMPQLTVIFRTAFLPQTAAPSRSCSLHELARGTHCTRVGFWPAVAQTCRVCRSPCGHPTTSMMDCSGRHIPFMTLMSFWHAKNRAKGRIRGNWRRPLMGLRMNQARSISDSVQYTRDILSI